MSALSRWIGVITPFLIPGLAHAYVGPGAGLSAIGSVIALIGATFLLILGFLWYPIKRLLRKKGSGSADQNQVNQQNPDSDSQA